VRFHLGPGRGSIFACGVQKNSLEEKFRDEAQSDARVEKGVFYGDEVRESTMTIVGVLLRRFQDP